jgi:hypothetical protein
MCDSPYWGYQQAAGRNIGQFTDGLRFATSEYITVASASLWLKYTSHTDIVAPPSAFAAEEWRLWVISGNHCALPSRLEWPRNQTRHAEGANVRLWRAAGVGGRGSPISLSAWREKVRRAPTAFAAAVPLRPEVQTYGFGHANEALVALKRVRVRGAKVLVVG